MKRLLFLAALRSLGSLACELACDPGYFEYGCECKLCPEGQICFGNTLYPCPVQTHNPASGAWDYEKCLPCPAATVAPEGSWRCMAACGRGTYQLQTCTIDRDRQCGPCTVCGAEEFQTVACNTSTNRECQACTRCGPEEWEYAACEGVDDRVCLGCTACNETEWEELPCTGASDRVCAACTECPAHQYQVAPCHRTGDALCENRTNAPTAFALSVNRTEMEPEELEGYRVSVSEALVVDEKRVWASFEPYVVNVTVHAQVVAEVASNAFVAKLSAATARRGLETAEVLGASVACPDGSYCVGDKAYPCTTCDLGEHI